MSRFLRQAVVWSIALVVVVVSAQASFAGGGHHGHHGYHNFHRYIYRAPVVHRTVYRPAPVIVAPAPIVAQPHLPTVPAGSTLTLPGNFMGPIQGEVLLVLDHVKLPVQINEWNPNGVTITLPPMAVKHPTPARLDVLLPHGEAINKVRISIVPPAPLVLHPTAPASPLPTGPVQANVVPEQLGSPIVVNPTL